MTYDRTPVPCVVSLQAGIRRVKRRLPHVTAPLLVIQGGDDQTVQPRSAQYIMDRAGSQHKQYKFYPNSSHGILLDRDKEAVFEDILTFLKSLDTLPPME
jgi:carboxylesterase